MRSQSSDTRSASRGPGVILVVLCRGRASTDVLLFGEDAASDGRDERREAVPRAAFLPRASARSDCTQWQLAERLLSEHRLDEVTRLYASALSVQQAGEAYGIFVGFVEARSRDAAMRAEGEWMDLREAIEWLPAPWSGPLGAVRERFVARSPDEALRVR